MRNAAGTVLVLALASCGGTQPTPNNPDASAIGRSTATPSAVDPGSTASASEAAAGGRFVRILGIMDCPGGCPSYSVSEALTQTGADVDPILVDGFLVLDDDGTVWFCEALTDMSPPQCSGERLTFEGQGALELLEGADWSEEVQLLGTVHP